MDPITVLLVDDHFLFREGIRALLAMREELEVVGEANNGREAVAMAREKMPDLVLMDVRMPVMGGVEGTRLIKSEMPSVQIVMLTASDEDSDLFGAIKAGAQGYILKNTPSDELVKQLQGVMNGEAPISGLMATKILAEFGSSSTHKESFPEERLTEREEEVLLLIREGDSNKEIADHLSITESTVKKHVRNILAKLHLRNRVEAALYVANKKI